MTPRRYLSTTLTPKLVLAILIVALFFTAVFGPVIYMLGWSGIAMIATCFAMVAVLCWALNVIVKEIF